MSATATLRMVESCVEPQAVWVGKDLLELLSSAMYEDPLTLYREYVQNAADSIDQARITGMLAEDEGTIEITIDPAARNVRIRDDGAGIVGDEFVSRMCSVGASLKRGTGARGFRGVGRLSGLAYAQRVTFRSRASATEAARQITWDCRRLRSGLKASDTNSLTDFIREITGVEELSGDWPDRFFEVELSGVVRYGDDRLVRAEAVSDYLAQVAPVPFSPEFTLASEILSWVCTTQPKPLRLTVNGCEPIYRPYRNLIEHGGKQPIHLKEIETFELPSVDGSAAARGWIAHHDYVGAIAAPLVKGLRVRIGDIQIGTFSLLNEVFPEPRFGSWAVGEIHIQDSRIVPNGRRDGFEQNTHFANLLNQLAPVTRSIAKRCRTSSSLRQRLRTLDAQMRLAEQKLSILAHQVVARSAFEEIRAQVDGHICQMEKITRATSWAGKAASEEKIAEYRRQLQLHREELTEKPLGELSGERGEAVREIIGLVFEYSTDPKAAADLVEKILSRLRR